MERTRDDAGSNRCDTTGQPHADQSSHHETQHLTTNLGSNSELVVVIVAVVVVVILVLVGVLELRDGFQISTRHPNGLLQVGATKAKKSLTAFWNTEPRRYCLTQQVVITVAHASESFSNFGNKTPKNKACSSR